MATTVVVLPEETSDWDHSICGCFDDCGACLLSYHFPALVFGMNAVDSGVCCEGCCGAFGGCVLWHIPIVSFGVWCCIRSKIREKHRIPSNWLADACAIFFCPCCALAQERQQCRPRYPQNQVTVIQQAHPSQVVIQQSGL